ncbi:5'-methylthioadenosine/adenosylhomocysteine nucleosidase [Tessaracoccus sp. SD287]|uniref:5'-methylthioadenosine/adenosylhomocysteine nucleosidase n=1 Tax=Tessaracoccus sp. SD287 TaxID=2782008 RepID=UPI001A961A01|nr:5'-methylthioadenosine/adenosylhomocysteine nucleosidase [Tessaracoccus sp. SD287]MBO1032194.1 5'-methylthioadenosine/adenosylhomocysteine nucleosidase [Tessaracoccus sp. SD287]
MNTQNPRVRAIIIAAMGQEIRPFCDRATNLGEVHRVGNAKMQHGQIDGVDVVLVRCGIGLVNSASATVAALHRWNPDLVISVGSAGGLQGMISRGDVVASTELTYSTADAVAFGYAMGQVPGMPVSFTGDADSLAMLRDQDGVVLGPIVSGDVFVSGYLLDSIMFEFPDTVAVDMESTAVAQVCHSYDVPFISIRGISDMCGVNASAEHDDFLDDVAERSAATVVGLLTRVGTEPEPARA